MRNNNYVKVNTVKGHLLLLGNSRAKAMTDNSNTESEDEQPLLGITIDSNLILKTISIVPLHKKWKLPLRASSVNVTKSAGNYGFRHIY